MIRKSWKTENKVVIWFRESDGAFDGRFTQVFDKDGLEFMKRPMHTKGLKSHEVILEDGERFIGLQANQNERLNGDYYDIDV